MVYNGDTALYGVNIEANESETIIDWIKSGIDTTAMSNIIVSPEGKIIYPHTIMKCQTADIRTMTAIW